MPESPTPSPTTSKKPLRKSKWTAMGSVGVFLFLVAGGALYYNYVVSHQAYVIDRNFRLLAMHGELIVDTVKNLKQVFGSAVEAGKATFSQNENPGACVSESFKEKKGNFENMTNLNPFEISRALCKSPWLHNVTVSGASANGNEETFEIDVNPRGTRSIILEYQRQLVQNNLKIVAELNLEELVNEFDLELEHELFDDLLVASAEGEVLFQGDLSRFHFSDVKAILNPNEKSPSENAKDQESPVQFPHYGQAEIGGIEYQVFAQSVQLPSKMEDKNSASLIVVGLLETSNFTLESYAISRSILVIIVLGVLVMFLSLPIIKLLLMGPRDRLSFLDVWFLLLATFLGTAVIVFVFVDWNGYHTLKVQRDAQLKGLSIRMLDNFSTEVQSMLQQIAKLDNQRFNFENSRENIFQIGNRPPFSTLLPPFDPTGEPYPYFDFVFWTDTEGDQQAKWTIKKSPSQMVNVRERESTFKE